MIEIKLTMAELYSAAFVGCLRNIQCVQGGMKIAHGADPKNAWSYHVEGAAGEMAVAKAAGHYWEVSVGTFHSSPDVGDWHVRTRSEHWHELIIRRDDQDNEPYILVTGLAPEFRIHGWEMGGVCKRPEYIQEHGGRVPAYFYPQDLLRPMDELPGWERAWDAL